VKVESWEGPFQLLMYLNQPGGWPEDRLPPEDPGLYVRPSNLAILRELTLREVARDIGRQRQENDLLNEWRAPQRSVGARVLVCLPSDQSDQLQRGRIDPKQILGRDYRRLRAGGAEHPFD